MKLSLDWLRDYLTCDLPPVADIAARMTLAGLEVDFFSEEHLDLSFTPDLGFARSHLGVARFLAPLVGGNVHLSRYLIKSDIQKELCLEIDSKALPFCPYYSVRYLEGISNGPSPEFIQKRLESVGSEPKNLIVDVTNYVLLAVGAPLHAFDAMKIGPSLKVCLSTEEPFMDLSHREHFLQKGSLIIRNSSKIAALAGIIGAESSCIDSSTTAILLEAALFNSSLLRKTGKQLKLSTQALQRFEQEIDPCLPEYALDYATYLLVKYGKAQVGTSYCLKTPEFETAKRSRLIPLRPNTLKRLLNLNWSQEEISLLFKKAEIIHEHSHYYAIPTYRTDLTEEIDLVEEIVRLYGLDKIQTSRPKVHLTALQTLPRLDSFSSVRKQLLHLGLQETLSSSLVDPEKNPSPEAIRVLSSLSDRSILRQSLLGGILETCSYNENFNNSMPPFFEIGKGYFIEDSTYIERPLLGVALPKGTFSQIKALFLSLFQSLSLEDIEWLPSEDPAFFPHVQAALHIGTNRIGIVGKVHPSWTKRYTVEQELCYGEIDLSLLPFGKHPTFNPISPYPAVERDWTLRLMKGTTFSFLSALIEAVRPSLLDNYTLISNYIKEEEENFQYTTIRFQFKSKNRSLTSSEVDSQFSQIKLHLEKEINA